MDFYSSGGDFLDSMIITSAHTEITAELIDELKEEIEKREFDDISGIVIVNIIPLAG